MTSSERKLVTSGAGRLRKKLADALAEKDYYTAHQLHRTIYFRLANQEKYDELIPFLYEGAAELLDQRQFSSGADLAILLLELLPKARASVEDASLLQKLRHLFERLNTTTSTQLSDDTDTSASAVSAVDRNAFIQLAVRWSKQVEPKYAYGHPSLHQQFALVFWQEKNYTDARYHFMLSQDGEGCATFLIEYQLSKGYADEVDLFVAQAVLQFLCFRKQVTASATFKHYTAHHPGISPSQPPFVLPLLNFLWLLLLCIEAPANPQLPKLAQFSTLVTHYHPSIQRDPEYSKYLDRIGQIFFGLPPPAAPTGGGGLFQQLFSSFLTPGGAADQNPGEGFEGVLDSDNESVESGGQDFGASLRVGSSGILSSLLGSAGDASGRVSGENLRVQEDDLD